MEGKKLNLAKTLSNMGVTLQGIDGEGKAIVQDPEGNTRTLNIEKTLSNLGVPSDVKFADVNDMNSPAELSPVNALSRGLLDIRGTTGAGERDSINFLKNKFEDARVNENGDMVVKTKGMWHKVDPDFWGNSDPYTLTKELLKGNTAPLKELVGDVAELAQESIDTPIQLATTAAGTAIGGLAGARAGQVAGQSVAKGVRTIFGKLAGIDNSSAQESLAENAWETLSALVTGKVVEGGMKVTGKYFAPALTKIAQSGSEKAKAIWAFVMQGLSGMPGDKFNKVIKDEASAELYTNLSEQIVDQARKTLPAGAALTPDVIEEVAEKRMYDNFAGVTKGFGKQAFNWFGNKIDEIKALPDIGKFSSEKVKGALNPEIDQLLAEKIITKDAKTGALNLSLDWLKDEGATLSQRRSAFKVFEKLKDLNSSPVSGKEGAEKLIELNKELNAFANDLFEADNPAAESLQAIFKPMLAKAKSGISQSLDNVRGAGQLWTEANQMWAETEGARFMSAKANNKNNGLNNVQSSLKKYIKGSPQERQNIELMMKYGSEADKRRLLDVDNVDVAKELTSYLPDAKSFQGSLKFLGRLAVAPKTATGRASRTVLKTLDIPDKSAKLMNQGLQAAKNMAVNLSPAARDAIISNEEAIGQIFSSILNMPGASQTGAAELLKRGLGQ